MKHVRNGSSISSSTALGERVPDVYERQKEYLKSLFSGQKVFVVLDETTDERTKLVRNITLQIRPVQSDKCTLKPYLVEFKICADYYDWDETDRLRHLKNSLDGTAANILFELIPGCSETDFVALLKARFWHTRPTGTVSFRVENAQT